MLIAGGTGPGNSTLDSTDIFDPARGSVMPGPRMTAARASFTATRMADGRILVAGGSDGSADLATSEIFDPRSGEFTAAAPLRTARQGHMAVIMPGNGRVLIAGGTGAGQAVDDAEVFVPWRGAFEPIAPGAAGGGSSIGIGRLDRNGKLVSSRRYGSPVLTVSDGAVSGAGWQPGEKVMVRVGEKEIAVTADANGRIAARDLDLPGGLVTARGSAGEAAGRVTPRN